MTTHEHTWGHLRTAQNTPGHIRTYSTDDNTLEQSRAKQNK